MARPKHMTRTGGRRTCAICRAPRNDHHPDDGHQFDAAHQCEKCGDRIEPGTPSKVVRQKRQLGGVTRRRCDNCPTWRQSELTNSPFLATIYEAGETAPDVACDPDDPEATVTELEALRDHYVDAANSAAEIRIEAADNMDDGFGHETSMSAELREQGESAQGVAEELESMSFPDHPTPDEYDGDDSAYADAFVNWAEDQVAEITDKFGEIG